jgi:pimeloyl-ACP methyl ester carboxylesterase
MNQAKVIYAISGLGADHRIYQQIDFGPHTVIPLPWLPPEKKESIEDYARRMSACIKHEQPVLVGLSFGGMMAMEIARHRSFQKILLISSAKTRAELPLLYKCCGALGLHHLIPMWLIKGSKDLVAKLFSPRSSREKELIDRMLDETDPDLLRWSIAKVVCWKNRTVPPDVYHIHGTRDHVLPFRNVSCDKALEGAGHIMILNRAVEISAWLNEVMNDERQPSSGSV